MSPSLGSGCAAMSAVAAMSCPGVQIPHWKPPSRMNASCSAFSSPCFASPSTVVIERPSTKTAGSRQADWSSPSTSTLHAPQTPTAQPSFVPVAPQSSRRTSMSRRSAGTVTSRRSPLSVKRRSCVLMHHRRGPVGRACSCVTAGGRGAPLTPDGSELVALDLARRGPGELGHEFDPPRVLVRREPVLDERAELAGKRGARRAVLEDDIGGRLGEGVRVLAPDDGAFEDRVVLEECGLDLERRDPDPADLEKVVAPPVVRVVAVGARRVPVAGEDPLAAKRPLRLRALLPVEGGGRRAADLQVADLAGRDETVALARHARLVAGDDLAGRARPRAAGAVRNGDVP